MEEMNTPVHLLYFKIMKYITTFVILFCFLSYGQHKWLKLNGPEGGDPTAIIAKGDTLIVSVGSLKTLVFYSTDKGNTWNKANLHLSLPNGLNAATVPFCFSSDGGIIAPSANKGIYKSLNFKDWVNVFQNGEVYHCIGKDQNQILYAGTQKGNIYYSSDNGQSWFLSLNINNNKSITAFLLFEDSLLFAGSLKQIYKKINNSWSPIEFPLQQFYKLFSDSGFIYTHGGSAILKSTNRGNDWFNLDANHFFGGNYAFSIIKNNRMIAACSDETYYYGDGWGIALSDDDGNNWYWNNNGLPPRLQGANGLAKSGQDTYVTLTAAGVYRSTDYGYSWFSANNGLYAAICLDMAFDKEGMLYTASWSNGVFKSSDKGQTWKKINEGLTNSYLYSIIADTNGNLIAGTDEGFFKSTDKGEHWQQGAHLGNNFFYKLNVDKQNRICAVMMGSGLYRTTNLGNSWQLLSSSFANKYLSSVAFDNSGAIYAGTSSGYIYKSTNDGVSWTLLINTSGIGNSQIETIVIASNGYIFAANSNQGILRSTDSGITWDIKNTGLDSYTFNSLALNKNGELFLSTKDDKVFYSNDNGENWILRMENLDQVTVYKIIFDENDNAFLGTDESVWSTEQITPVELLTFIASVNNYNVNLQWSTSTEKNNKGFYIERNSPGKDWNQIAFIEGKGTTILKSEYSYTDKNLNEDTYNYRLRQIDYDGSSKIYNLNESFNISAPLEYSLKQNYPNPFNPSTTIEYSVRDKGTVKLVVYDAFGRAIKVLVNQIKEHGIYTVSFEKGNLASGVYFYSMEAGTFRKTNKMLLLK